MIRSQRGIAHLIPILVVLVLAIGGVGYYVWQQRTGGTVSLPLVGPSAKCDYNDANLCKFLNNFKVQNNYTVTSSSGQGAQKADFKVQISGQDRSQSVMSQGGKETYNVITIKDTTYTKDLSDGKWWKEVAEKTKDTVKSDVTFSTNDTSKESAPKSEYKAIGKEACGKLECYKYQVIMPGNTATEFIWFDTKQYLLRKYSVSSKEGGTMTAEYSYDKVTINEPSPIKQGTAGSASAAAAAPTQAQIDAAIKAAQASQPVDTTPVDTMPVQ